MGRLDSIKAKLAKLLIEVEMSQLKTDNGIFVYEGEEIAVGTALFIEDEEGNRTPAENGTYTLEDGKKIVVEDGKIAEIIEVEEPAEEEIVEEPAEEVAAEEVVEEPAPAEEQPAEEEKDNVAELTKRVEDLEATMAEIVAAMEALKTETLSKLNMSAAQPAEVEFENVKNTNSTGFAKVDKFLERYGK